MAVMSSQQKDDLKTKIGLGIVAVVIFGPLLVLGPLLKPVVLKHYETKKLKAPGTPERFYQIATVMMNSFREEEAIKVYTKAYVLFGDDHDSGDIDFSPVLDHDTGYGIGEYYLPWVVEAQPDGVRPDPVQIADRATMAKILAKLGQYYEDKKDYQKCNHIWVCLDSLWPVGSPGQRDGAQGILRSKTRSFN